ncbi:MAG: hypothetical protein IJT86_04055 [Spirochaetales bacterium]|nr:hypothetical protein [Spirochaetales bacterium]MBQ7729507.1 hypothetical protein [Spirochaetales bacterium]
MRRILATLISLVICSTLHATTLLDSRLYAVNTHVDHYCLITLTAEEATLSSGMPFDITESRVQYNSANLALGTGGRKIATWSIEANMNSFTLSFDAQPFTSAADESNKLGYYLIFKYNTDDYFTLHVPATGSAVTSANPAPPSTGPLTSMHKDLMFMFDESADTANAPSGAYLGSITITLTEGI